MKQLFQNYGLSLISMCLVFTVLIPIELMTKNHMIILGRFFSFGGWIEIVIIGFYAAFLVNKMKKPENVPVWRQRSWVLFTVVFFGQLLLGLIGFDKFLMTGKLHLPIPAMIIAGPIFRGESSFMTILFLSTIIISGPTWCSHLCYFGAMDGMLASGKTSKKPLKNKFRYRHSILIFVVGFTILLRIINIELIYAIIFGATFGIIGLLIIIFISGKKKKMVHCVAYCPVGAVISYLKFLNPFRLRIDNSCTMCAHCIPQCKYDALNFNDLKNKKPGLTCTLCGDCITACHAFSIQYKFFNLSPNAARNLYLAISVSLHATFLALGKI